MEARQHVDAMTHKQKRRELKVMKYSKKFAAGKVIGLQNIIPEFAEQTEMVIFTDNNMVAELHEVDVGPLREELGKNRQVLEKFWRLIMPSALMLLHS